MIPDNSKSNEKNKYGGERAKCPKCGKYNSDLYEFLKEDWRDLECSECLITKLNKSDAL